MVVDGPAWSIVDDVFDHFAFEVNSDKERYENCYENGMGVISRPFKNRRPFIAQIFDDDQRPFIAQIFDDDERSHCLPLLSFGSISTENSRRDSRERNVKSERVSQVLLRV